MIKKTLILIVLGLISLPLLAGDLLEAPKGLTHRIVDGQPMLAWDPVEGARLYRVAVFGPADTSGSRPAMAAVWVDVTRWHYAVEPVLPKAGNWKSTAPADLKKGTQYRWMVSAAKSGEKDKGPWSAAMFTLPEKETAAVVPLKITETASTVDLTRTATASPTPIKPLSSPTATPTPEESEGEFVEDGGLDTIDFGSEEADSTEDRAESTPSRAQQLLKEKKYTQAADEFLELIEKDEKNADAWQGLGDAYKGQRLKLEAVEAYEKALELDPKRKDLDEWIKQQRRF